MAKRSWKTLLFSMTLSFMGCLLSQTILAAEDELDIFPEKPKKGQFVVDYAQVLSPAEASSLNANLQYLATKYSLPIVLVTLKSMARLEVPDLTLKSYTEELFEKWWPYVVKEAPPKEKPKTGREAILHMLAERKKVKPIDWRYRGILVVVSVFDRETEVFVGEHHSPLNRRRWASRIKKYVEAYLHQDRNFVAKGMFAACKALEAVKNDKPEPPLPKDAAYYLKVGAFALAILYMFYSLLFQRETSRLWFYLGYVFWAVAALFTSAAIQNEMNNRERNRNFEF